MPQQIEEVRRVVKGEQRILESISRLSDSQYGTLIQGQSGLAALAKAQQEAEEEKKKFQNVEKEKNALINLQDEKTKQMEVTLRKRAEEQEQSHKAQIDLLEKQREEEKERVNYALQKETDIQKERTKIRLEAKKEFDRLDFERKKREEEAEEEKARARKKEREEEYVKMTEFEKIRIETQAKLDQKAEVELAEHRFKQDLLLFEATKDNETHNRRRLLEIEMEYAKQISQQKYNAILAYFHGEGGRERARNIATLVALSAVSVGLVSVFVPIAKRALNKYLFSPRLISRVQHSPSRLFGSKDTSVNVVLQPALEERMNRILKSTEKMRERGGHYGNLLLYGKPGTGKTLWAEKLARESNMRFAVMSGPSFDQFTTPQAIQEIRNLFDWANARPLFRSSQGVLLFIDEADSFLEDRSLLHPHRIAVLNEWINQTGTESKNFMCIYETNRPEVLDPAIQSRVSASVEFLPPQLREIEIMLKYYIKKYVTSDQKIGVFRTVKGLSSPYLEDDANIHSIAERMEKEGFVGRDISNFAINLFKAGTGTGEGREITAEMVGRVLSEQLDKKVKEKSYLEIRNRRLEDHKMQLVSAYL